MAENQPDKKKNMQNMVAIGILCVGLLFCYWKYLLLPLNEDIKKAETELSQKQAKLEETRQAAQELEYLQAEFKVLEIEAKEMEKKLPKTKELPSLIKTITKTLENNYLNILTMTPMKETGKTYYSEFPILLSITGSYHDLAKFISEIGQMDRVINTYDIVMTAKPETKDSRGTMSASLKLVTYTAK